MSKEEKDLFGPEGDKLIRPGKSKVPRIINIVIILVIILSGIYGVLQYNKNHPSEPNTEINIPDITNGGSDEVKDDSEPITRGEFNQFLQLLRTELTVQTGVDAENKPIYAPISVVVQTLLIELSNK